MIDSTGRSLSQSAEGAVGSLNRRKLAVIVNKDDGETGRAQRPMRAVWLGGRLGYQE